MKSDLLKQYHAAIDDYLKNPPVKNEPPLEEQPLFQAIVKARQALMDAKIEP